MTKNRSKGTKRIKKLLATKVDETLTIADAKEIRLLKQHKKTTKAAPNKKKPHETIVLTVAFWKADAAPTDPPTG